MNPGLQVSPAPVIHHPFVSRPEVSLEPAVLPSYTTAPSLFLHPSLKDYPALVKWEKEKKG
ncbi:MAG: hypothetical protein DSO02_04675 [Hadesarchaea archaeon]|nr:MAG: hypothetical protein DSO02_04675 [Hadesarchaea archaeon]